MSGRQAPVFRQARTCCGSDMRRPAPNEQEEIPQRARWSNRVVPVDAAAVEGDSGSHREKPGPLRQWLQSIQDKWQDFREEHRQQARALEILYFIVQLGLYVYDIVSDVIVVQELFAAGYTLYAALTLLFTLSHYPVMGVLLLYFLEPTIAIDHQTKDNVKLQDSGGPNPGHRLLTYIAFLPISIWMVPAVDLYMLLLPIVASRDGRNALLIKLLGFMDSYEQARFPLQCLLQSLPQMFLQLYIYVSIAHGAHGPDVSMSVLLVSIAASSVNSAKCIATIWLGAQSTGLGWRYLWCIVTLQGASSLHAHDEHQLRARLAEHCEQAEFAPLVLSRAEGQGDDVLPRLVPAQLVGAMRFVGRRLLHHARQVQLQMPVREAMDMLHELEQQAEAHRLQAASSFRHQPLQHLVSPAAAAGCFCIVVKQGSDVWDGAPTFVNILAMPQAHSASPTSTTSTDPEYPEQKDKPWSLALLLRCLPRLQELHFGPGTFVDLHCLPARGSARELLEGPGSAGGGVRLLLECCKLLPDTAGQLGFQGLLTCRRFSEVVLFTRDSVQATEAWDVGGGGRAENGMPRLVVFSDIDAIDAASTGAGTGAAAALLSSPQPQLPQHYDSTYSTVTIDMDRAGAGAPRQAAVAAATILSSPLPQPQCYDSTVTCCSRTRPLDSIALPHCNLVLSDAMALAAALSLRTSITSLDLSHNLLGPAAVEALVAAPLPGLRRLLLAGNAAVGDAGAEHLAMAVSSGWLPQLEELRLDNTGIARPAAARLLLDAVFDLRSLAPTGVPAVKLTMDDEGGAASWMSAAIAAGDTEAQIMAALASITSETVHRQVPSIQAAWRQSVGGGNNDICSNGRVSFGSSAVTVRNGLEMAVAIAAAATTTIKICIADRGAQGDVPTSDQVDKECTIRCATALTMGHGRSLLWLSIAGMDMSAAGAKEHRLLSAALSHGCPNLQRLSLNDNDIDAAGAKVLAHGVKASTSLQRIDLGGISLEAACSLVDVLTAAPTGPQPPASTTPVRGRLQRIVMTGLCPKATPFCFAGFAKTRRSESVQELLDGMRFTDQQTSDSDIVPTDPGRTPQCQAWIDTTDWDISSVARKELAIVTQHLHEHKDTRRLVLSGSNTANDVLGPLFDWVRCNDSLEHLALKGCNAVSGQMANLGAAMQRHRFLTHLDISNNNIGDEGCLALAEGVELCPRPGIKQLYMNDNDYNDIGTKSTKACPGYPGLPGLHSLQHLNLDNNNIGSKGATALGAVVMTCPNLQRLDLGQNNIGTQGAAALAEGLSSCPGLQHLNMNKNNFGSEGAAALAEGIKACPGLQRLELHSNSIGSEGAAALAEGIKACPGLQDLLMGDNNIGLKGASALAEGIKACPHLHVLVLYTNNIGNDGAKAVAEGVRACSTLQCLGLGHNNIGNEGIAALAGGIKACPGLQYLHLENNSIGSEGAAAVAEGIKACPSLQRLELHSNSIGGEGAAALAEGIKACPGLQNLNVHKNSIGSEGAAALAEGIKACPGLQDLLMGDNNIGPKGASALAEGIKACPHLQVLVLYTNNIGDDGAKAVAEGVRACSTLQCLGLGQNNIGNEGIAALAEGIKACPGLQHLYLENNSIGSEGAAALAEGIKACPGLQRLELHNNSIGSEGAAALAEGIKACPGLQHLNMHKNSIGSEGAAALAEGIKACPGLQRLELHNNSIGSEGAAALAEGIKVCPRLHLLNLDSNNICDSGAKAVAEGMKACLGLQDLDVGRNSIGSEGAMALAEGVKACPGLQRLDMYDNRIGPSGAGALALGIKACPVLTFLDLGQNGIGSEGAAAVAEGVKACPGLQRLCLSINGIGDEAAEAIAEGIKACPGLLDLDMYKNSIGNAGAKALAEGVKACPNLQRLDLGQNHIGSEGAKALAEGFTALLGLQDLDLLNNKINDEGALAVAEGVKGCPGLQRLNLRMNGIRNVGAVADALGKIAKACPNIELLI